MACAEHKVILGKCIEIVEYEIEACKSSRKVYTLSSSTLGPQQLRKFIKGHFPPTLRLLLLTAVIGPPHLFVFKCVPCKRSTSWGGLDRGATQGRGGRRLIGIPQIGVPPPSDFS